MINGVVSLPVRALPVVPGEPVRKGSVLLEINVERLDRELRERQNDLRRIQEEKRYRASNKEVQRGGGGSTSGQRPDTSVEANLGLQEADAMRDMLEVQTRISQASPRAPADGYLVRTFYAVGADTKRRKPLVSFIPADKTVLVVALSGAVAADFPSGAAVSVSSAEDAKPAFRGVIVSSLASETDLEVTIRPLELPFLALERPATVTVERAP